ncbi:hypothetical protein [Novosphingobium aquimarinum]|uniref:hypothetical protein n=1 Tax=Novosphingobium aquimarinum TaxID=2682494 RepID=UPI0012EBA279|nr:hypothetical protein [Novosphingobium aquimarinum]
MVRRNFDPSFNKGGDTIVIEASAVACTVLREGSNAVLESDDALVRIPVGLSTTQIVFAYVDTRALMIVDNNIDLSGQRLALMPIGISAIA